MGVQCAQDPILSTQRIPGGRDPDFIYTKNLGGSGSDFIYTKNFAGMLRGPDVKL